MQLFSQISYQWSTKQNRYILVSFRSKEWFGSVACCKGASSAQQNLANQQAAFYQTLTQDYGQQFAAQNAILQSINSTLNPIIAAGPSQFGFSTGETNTLNSAAIQGTGQAYAQADQALKQQQAAAGGGNSYLPSGVQTQQQQQLATNAANQKSQELLGIQQAGFQQGYNTFESAIGQEEGAAGLYSPTAYAGAATGAGQAAGSELNTIQQENNAASPWGVIGGLLGGVAGGLTGGLGSSLGGLFGGGGGGGQSYGPSINWS